MSDFKDMDLNTCIVQPEPGIAMMAAPFMSRIGMTGDIEFAATVILVGDLWYMPRSY
jgi:hypothetical protein